MLRRRFLIAVAVAATALLASATPSQASFKLKLQSGADIVTYDLTTATPTIIAGESTASATSSLSFGGLTSAGFFNLQFAGYSITTQSDTNNVPGTTQLGFLALNNFTITNTGDATGKGLVVSLTATDFTAPGEAKHRSMSSLYTAIFGLQATANSTIKLETAYDEDNGEFTSQGDAEIYDQANFVAPVGSNSGGGASLPGGGTSPSTAYSLTDKITITGLAVGGSIGQADARAEITATPAPAGLILVATAVPFFGLLRRRMKTVATN